MQKDLFSFLRFGYYLDYPVSFEVRPKVLLDDLESYEDKKKSVLSSLRREIEGFIYKNKNKKIVVPLSGGYDSRLLIALVLDYFESKDICTYTFGVPGTYDFDIANMIADFIGTNHIAIDMNDLKFTFDDVFYNNRKVNNQCLLFYSTPFSFLDRLYGQDAVFFSGFMGDPIAGSKFINSSFGGFGNDYWIDKFLVDNTITSFDFAPDYDNVYFLSGSSLSAYENIDFHNRQAKYIHPHVFPDDNYFTPFLGREFIDIMFSLSDDERAGCSFYKSFCLDVYPALFSKPIKQFSGLSCDSSKLKVFISKVKNSFLAKFSDFDIVKYIDKRTNYFKLKYRLESDPDFYNVFYYFFNEGFKELNRLGVLSNKYKVVKDVDMLVVASLGVQYLSGKRW